MRNLNSFIDFFFFFENCIAHTKFFEIRAIKSNWAHHVLVFFVLWFLMLMLRVLVGFAWVIPESHGVLEMALISCVCFFKFCLVFICFFVGCEHNDVAMLLNFACGKMCFNNLSKFHLSLLWLYINNRANTEAQTTVNSMEQFCSHNN